MGFRKESSWSSNRITLYLKKPKSAVFIALGLCFITFILSVGLLDVQQSVSKEHATFELFSSPTEVKSKKNRDKQSEIINHETYGHEISKQFKPIDTKRPMEFSYVTLWLRQCFQWWYDHVEFDLIEMTRKFAKETKDSGFTHVVFDLPWIWTAFVHGLDLGHFHEEQIMTIICEADLKLRIVLSMSEFPKFLYHVQDGLAENNEVGSSHETCNPNHRTTLNPTFSSEFVTQLTQKYIHDITFLLFEKYGSCISSISPTFNTLYESSMNHEHMLMRDYSQFHIDKYKAWQVSHGFAPSIEEALEPPQIPCEPICDPIVDESTLQWLEFRKLQMDKKYTEACQMIRTVSNAKDQTVTCLLRFGEMFSSMDLLNSNVFFDAIQSPFVDGVVMQSDIFSYGSPSSPSIVGVLISTAKYYGKIVHYELSTELTLPCTDLGNLEAKAFESLKDGSGARLLLQSGLERALEAGVDGIGFANLCEPSTVNFLLPPEYSGFGMQTASSFIPTALIFVPYQAFYAWSHVVSGVSCDTPQEQCWHESFDQIETFGFSKTYDYPGTCKMDIAQKALLKVWDDVRTRHSQVAVIMDTILLNDNLLRVTSENVLLRFPCIMTKEKWHLFNGEVIRSAFEEKTKFYSFREEHADMPGTCVPIDSE